MKKVSRRNRPAAMLKEKLIRPTHCTMNRKYPEIRLVHVVQRRNTSLVVVLQQEDRLQLQTTTVLKMESIEKIRNRGRKRETWWFCMVVMEVLLTWVHFAYEHHLPLISETKSRRRRRSKDYVFRGMLFQIFLKSSWDCNNQVSLYLKCIIICLVVVILHVELR